MEVGTAAGSVAAPPPRRAIPQPSPRPARSWRDWAPASLLGLIALCVAAAAVTAAVLPTVPSYDPWSWITWGREVFDPHLGFAVGGGPSWKPLPVCFTAVYGLFGSAAPTLWVITARAGGLLGLVAAYRLAARLAARRSLGGAGAGSGDLTMGAGAWGAVAGLIAVVAVALTQQYAYYMFRGTSEPMLIGAVLWAVDRHFAGRRGSAYVLLVAAAQIRPEAWPFLGLYGVWLCLRRPDVRVLVVLGWLSVPVLWFVPPWLSTGQPFLAAIHAKDYNGHLGANRLATVLGRAVDLQVVPVLVLALVATAVGWVRGRDRLVLGLAAAAAAWWAIVVAMTLVGYPGLERFFLPGAAVICGLGAAGFVAVGRLAAAAVRRAVGGVDAGSRAPSTWLAAGVVVALVAVSAPLSSGRASTNWAQEGIAARAVTRLHDLSRAVAAVGGYRGVYPCPTSFAAVNHAVQSALAWKLRVMLVRVGKTMPRQGLDFVGPTDSIDSAPALVARSLTQRTLIATVGEWKVYRVTAPGADTRCVGR